MPLLSGALKPTEAALLANARRAVLGTVRQGGRPRLVPVTFAYDADTGALYFALDDKPKTVADPRHLARVRDIETDPRVTLLVDRWSEDWSKLAWLRLDGEATLLEPADHAEEHAFALHLLRERYQQYADHRLEQRPIVRIEIERATSWGCDV